MEEGLSEANGTGRGLGSGQMSPEQMVAEIKRQQKEIEYLKRQREILKKAMSILGEEPNPGSDD